jgi:hypothetical protein
MRKLLVIPNAMLRDRQLWRAPQSAWPSETVASPVSPVVAETKAFPGEALFVHGDTHFLYYSSTKR